MINRKLVAIILIIALMCIPVTSFAAASNLHTAEATNLQTLGLMAGGLKDQSLDQQMTRLQGLIFAIRAAGKAPAVDQVTDAQVASALAKYSDSSAIPTYGKKYMAYAIMNNITTGIGNNKLGPLNSISGTSFLVFLLKIGMGYSGANTANIIDLAYEANVITFEQKSIYAAKPVLIRDDAAVILYKAVIEGINDDGVKFIDSLINGGFVSRTAFESINTQKDAENKADTTGSLSVEEIAKNSDYVVLLTNMNSKGEPMSFGSGFLVTADGKIATNYHVIDGASSMTATLPDGRVFTITSILAYDETKDLAVLQANGLTMGKALTLGDSDKIAIGEQVVAIGNPEGLQNTVSVGIISSKRYSSKRNANDLQITAPISPGSSGGPLFNMKGEVVGINYAGLVEGQNLNFSIPVADLKPLLQNMTPKTFAEVTEVTKPSIILEDLSNSLFAKYGTINIDGKIINLDYYYTCFRDGDPDSKLIFHFIRITDMQSITNFYDCINDPALQIKLTILINHAMIDVEAQYPDCDQFGGIQMVFSSETKPTSHYDSAIFNSVTNKWDVEDTCFYFEKTGNSYSTSCYH